VRRDRPWPRRLTLCRPVPDASLPTMCPHHTSVTTHVVFVAARLIQRRAGVCAPDPWPYTLTHTRHSASRLISSHPISSHLTYLPTYLPSPYPTRQTVTPTAHRQPNLSHRTLSCTHSHTRPTYASSNGLTSLKTGTWHFVSTIANCPRPGPSLPLPTVPYAWVHRPSNFIAE
jgi:hypothetical protein